MNRSKRAVLFVVCGLSVLIVSACGSTAQPLGVGSAPRPAQGTGMMGGQGPGMMGGSGGPDSPGYSYSRLTCAAPGSVPGQAVRVVLADMGMNQMMGGVAPMGARMMLRATPGTVSSATISLVAQNMGWRTHELVILPLTGGERAGQRVPGADGKVNESGSLGEASASCAPGSGEGIAAGAIGWTTATLAPGRYELVCNLANHYSDGMWQELDVAGAQG